MEIPLEYNRIFLSNGMVDPKIERPRYSYLGDNWAYNLAAIIGDYYSLKFETLAVYPSSFWITSLLGEARKKYNTPNVKGDYKFNDLLMSVLMKNFPEKMYSKLESCYPSFLTSQQVFFQDFYNYYVNILKTKLPTVYKDWEKGYLYTIKDLENSLPSNCCSQNMILDKSGKFICYDFKIQFATTVKFFIKNGYNMLKMVTKNEFLYKETYDSEVKVKNYQNVLKNILMCHGPLGAIINMTSEYQSHFYVKSDTKKMIFEKLFIPTLKIPPSKSVTDERKEKNYNLQPVTILGWGKDEISGREFWYIRDPLSGNFGGEFYKIAFSTFLEKDVWIGPDLPYHDKKNREIIGSQYFLDVVSNVSVNDMVEQDIVENDYSFLLE